MAVSRHLGFYRITNSAIRSVDPENPGLEPNMEWIGYTVCEIFAFKLYCDLGTGVRGHSRSSKVALFDRAHTTSYSCSIVTNYASIYYRLRDIAAYWPKIATPLYLASPLGIKPLGLRNDPCWRKTRMIYRPIRPWKNFDDTFSRFDTKHACDRVTDGIGVAYTALSIASRGKILKHA